jgi:nitrite reductase (NADH) large subunit
LDPIVIIGAGPIGVKAANELLNKSEDLTVKIFNGESDRSYKRAQLSYYLAGDLGLTELGNPLKDEGGRLAEYEARKIKEIRAADRFVIDDNGLAHPYQKLIIATGSTVRPPAIPGVDKAGVYCFRSLRDAQDLSQWRAENRNVFVIGSGPLGIETALAMKTHSNKVYLQVRSSLLTPHLDDNAREVLSDYIRSIGIDIIENSLVQRILGNGKVTGVEMTDNKQLDVDIVIMCTGVSPLKELASRAGIVVERGVLVDDFMRTNCEHIYAIGEVAEHRGVTHGLILAGYEQAEACVSHIIKKAKPYSGQPGELHFTFRGFSSQILGNINLEGCQVIIYQSSLKSRYRKLLLNGKQIKAAVIVGQWGEVGRISALIKSGENLERSAIKRFRDSGSLWDDQTNYVQDHPKDYLICLCKGVTLGEISTAMDSGHRTVSSLGTELGAGVTCGSCKSLLSEILNQPVRHLIMRHYKKIFFASVISVAMILFTFFAPKLSFDRSVQIAFQFETVWYDRGFKQATGYTLLIFIVLSSILSLRKRSPRLNHGNLDDWRFAHTILGLLALFAVVVHTGLRLGENLSFALMFVFLLATMTGSLVGVFMSKNHHWTDIKLTQYRAWWSRVHYGLLWLLPALLCFHVLSSYYFA